MSRLTHTCRKLSINYYRACGFEAFLVHVLVSRFPWWGSPTGLVGSNHVEKMMKETDEVAEQRVIRAILVGICQRKSRFLLDCGWMRLDLYRGYGRRIQ